MGMFPPGESHVIRTYILQTFNVVFRWSRRYRKTPHALRASGDAWSSWSSSPRLPPTRVPWRPSGDAVPSAPWLWWPAAWVSTACAP